MKRTIKSILVILTLVILTASCKKSSSSNTSNSTNGNFTLKYEVITSSPIVVANAAFGTPVFVYENGTQQIEYDYSFTSGTVWTKEVTVTTTNRPFQALLQHQPPHVICLASPGTVTSNIYVNGNQVSHAVNPTQTASGVYFAVVGMQYIIQ